MDVTQHEGGSVWTPPIPRPPLPQRVSPPGGRRCDTRPTSPPRPHRRRTPHRKGACPAGPAQAQEPRAGRRASSGSGIPRGAASRGNGDSLSSAGSPAVPRGVKGGTTRAYAAPHSSACCRERPTPPARPLKTRERRGPGGRLSVPRGRRRRMGSDWDLRALRAGRPGVCSGTSEPAA